MVLVIGCKVVFSAVKVGIAPVPFAANPIVVLVLVQENSKLAGVVAIVGVPVNTICDTVVPSQYVKFGSSVAIVGAT